VISSWQIYWTSRGLWLSSKNRYGLIVYTSAASSSWLNKQPRGRGSDQYCIPDVITPVQVVEVEQKSVNWLIGNDNTVEDNFDLITKVDSAGTGGDFTKAVKLSLASDLKKH
jgi:hypothetical protein